jgi:transcriptional regulator with XRE-family HTH domain
MPPWNKLFHSSSVKILSSIVRSIKRQFRRIVTFSLFKSCPPTVKPLRTPKTFLPFRKIFPPVSQASIARAFFPWYHGFTQRRELVMELKIGENISRYRRERHMTQEQLARSVGVSPPAVSKWETESSYPDVTLLSPIARALGITVDILLSFQEELTEEEVDSLYRELQGLFGSRGFSAGQQRCEELLHEYPNSAGLKLTVGGLYQTMLGTLPSEELTEERVQEILRLAAQLYSQVRASGDPRYFAAATVGLAAFRLSENRLEETEALLDSLPKVEIDPNELYPSLYLAQGKSEQAEKLLEAHLFQLLRSASLALHSLASLSQERDGTDRALFLCGLSLRLAELFDLEDVSGELEYSAVLLMKQGRTREAVDRLEQYAEKLAFRTDYSSHPIFPHLSFRTSPEKLDSSRRMAAKALELTPAFEPLQKEPRFRDILEKLAPSSAL